MNRRTLVDTNVLVYLFDSTSPAKRKRAEAVIQEHWTAGTLVVSTQVLQELYVVLTRKLKPRVPDEIAVAALERLAALPVVSPDAAMIIRAARLSQASRISFWDALLVRSAVESGCRRLLSEDLQDGWVVDGLEVVSPFRK